MELTKEYFDKRLDEQAEALMAFAEAQTETLARVIADTIAAPMQEGFDRLETKLDRATARIDVLERKVQRIEEALHITL
ncbi:MAG TPA: hypothetical protein VFQ47_08225 [Nitrososphaera sp.]|jgi:uncharacterized protein YqgV (UPF0045/DUF77 family)|nr:hypothetical protein [Nitrososphaera sp.]